MLTFRNKKRDLTLTDRGNTVQLSRGDTVLFALAPADARALKSLLMEWRTYSTFPLPRHMAD